jgi:hypothetical protein
VIHTGCERGLRHRRALEILPIYVNGSLRERLLRDLETHSCDCPACRRESSTLSALFSAHATSPSERQVDESRLTDLLARIDRYETLRVKARS